MQFIGKQVNALPPVFEEELPPFCIPLIPVLEKTNISKFDQQTIVDTYMESGKKDQDFMQNGKSGNMTWIVACDGHGHDEFIDWIRDSVDWKPIMDSVDPVNTLLELYLKSPIYRQSRVALESGATLSMVRILEMRETGECLIETINIGDSSTMIFVDDQLMYINEGHTYQNTEEIERLRKMEVSKSIQHKIEQKKTPKVLSESEITMSTTYTVEYQCKMPRIRGEINYDSQTYRIFLTPTQSLGHLGITGFKPDKHLEHCYMGEKIRVIVCTDGVTDMLAMDYLFDMKALASLSARQIGKMASMRWRQKWKMVHPKTREVIRENIAFLEGEQDDISIAIWDRLPISTPFRK
jgi:serine/threonine protein phosphatase PrpC